MTFKCFVCFQAALLSLREKALREKAKAELAWLDQLKQQPRDKRADDMFPNLEKKEKTIRKNLQVQQVRLVSLCKVLSRCDTAEEILSFYIIRGLYIYVIRRWQD